MAKQTRIRTREPRIRRTIRQLHSGPFEIAEQLLEAAHNTLASLCESEVHESNERAKAVVVGLCAKVCKQLHAIIVLCELGLTEDAETLARALFESVLRVKFIVLQRPLLKRGWRTAPGWPRKRPSMEFRAEIYLARCALDDQKRVRAFKQTKGGRRLGKRLEPVMDRFVKAAEKRIGVPWMQWLSDDTKSRDAFKVERLADTVRMSR